MAKTVNYAGTVLGLNTEKYTKSLNTLKTQSASCANSIKNSFKGMAAGLAGAFSAVASFNKIVNSLKKTMRARFQVYQRLPEILKMQKSYSMT